MATHKRGISGSPAAPASGAKSIGDARDNTKEATYWCSHRGGPFLIHWVGKGCEAKPIDNAGYIDDLDVAIAQGFAPCPICMK